MTEHPTLHRVEVRCSTCGATFDVRSTTAALTVESCSHCHPAYTGHAAATASGTRIERFERRRALASV